MTWEQFWIVFGVCALTILICRVVPLFVLKGRSLPAPVARALTFIPPAAFAALVANDLLEPDMFAGGIWPAAAPLIAAFCVAVIGFKTRSLITCVIVGVGVYAILLLIPV